jgi:hypothetical protein
VSQRINGWRKDLEDIPVQSIQETELSPAFMIPSAPVQKDGGETRKRVIVEPPFRPEETPDYKKVKDGEYQDRDLLYLALMDRTGELHYPAYLVEYTIKEVVDPSRPMHTELQYVRSITRRVTLAEGEFLSVWRRWYSITSTLWLMLACLISLVMVIPWMPGYDWLNAFAKAHVALMPICLVAAFSLGLLVQKLGSFGWRRLLRRFWVRHSPNPSKKSWRELVRSLGDSDSMRKGQSSQS